MTFSLDGWRSWFGEMACFFMASPPPYVTTGKPSIT